MGGPAWSRIGRGRHCLIVQDERAPPDGLPRVGSATGSGSGGGLVAVLRPRHVTGARNPDIGAPSRRSEPGVTLRRRGGRAGQRRCCRSGRRLGGAVIDRFRPRNREDRPLVVRRQTWRKPVGRRSRSANSPGSRRRVPGRDLRPAASRPTHEGNADPSPRTTEGAPRASTRVRITRSAATAARRTPAPGCRVHRKDEP